MLIEGCQLCKPAICIFASLIGVSFISLRVVTFCRYFKNLRVMVSGVTSSIVLTAFAAMAG